MLNLTIFSLISLLVACHAFALEQNPKLTNMADGFLELKPNGSLFLRSTLNNSSQAWQEAVVFKSILNAIRLMPVQAKNTLSDDLKQKIYGEGVEHKFPPFLERIIQRIQTYFSIYKYTDTSEPVRVVKQPTTSTTTMTMSTSTSTATSPTLSEILNETLTLGQNEIAVNLTSNSGFNKNNKTTLNMDKLKRPFEATTNKTTTNPTTVVYEYDGDEENEFFEIKNKNLLENTQS